MKRNGLIVMALVAVAVIAAGLNHSQNRSHMLAFGVLDESLREIAFVDLIYSRAKSQAWEAVIVEGGHIGTEDFEGKVLPTYFLDLRIEGVNYTLSVWDEGEAILMAFDYVMTQPYTLEAGTYLKIGRAEYEALYAQGK